MWSGAKYTIIKNVDLIAAYYHYVQNQYVSGIGICTNTGAHGQCAGTQDMWSAVVDWRFLPKNGTFTSARSSRRSMAALQTATSPAITSPRRPAFASASKRSVGIARSLTPERP